MSTHFLVFFVEWLVDNTEFVDGLRHADDVTVRVMDGHAENAACLVTCLLVNLAVKACVLVEVKTHMLASEFKFTYAALARNIRVDARAG